MDYAEFMKSTKRRNRFVFAWLALTGILLVPSFIFLSVDSVILGFFCLVCVFAESVIFLSMAFKEKRRNYDLFQNNTIIINKDTVGKLRETDILAIEKYEGNLKQALQHITTTPDFTRAERMDYIIKWNDYERDFITQQYGAEPHRVAKSSRRLPLCADGQEYIRVACVKKYTHLSYDDSSVKYLDFGSHGRYEVNETHLYYLTEPGDEFYILKSPDGKYVKEAYSLLDWELIE